MSDKPDKSSHNRKRSSYISFLKRKNYQLDKEIKEHMIEALYKEVTPNGMITRSHLTEVQEDHLLKLSKAVTQCANFSLYALNTHAKDVTYIASGTCGHKCCNVCNYARQKTLRRKYFKWFNENSKLLQIRKHGSDKIKTVTQTQFKDKYSGSSIVVGEVEYDLMHLTLTVPHYKDSGFRGKIFFYSEIIELFNWMRKNDEWLEMVYGGEFGVETERKDSGMHIHIHSLLLVKRMWQNRNILHQFILKKWNSLTVNEFSKRDEFTPEAIQKIKESNKQISDTFIKSLNPKGATIIGLETIYSLDDNGNKRRSGTWGSGEMIKAVMETISYHFEPHAFNKEEKKINIPLLADLLPEVYRKILYKKFGCLHGEKELNVATDPTPEELEKELREAASLQVDEETGEIIEEREFFICNPAGVFHDKSNDNKIILSKNAKQRMRFLDANGSGEAIKQMGYLIAAQFKKQEA